MGKAIVLSLVLITMCFSASALGRNWNTGHLIVTFTDKETGGPITNATVTVETLINLGVGAGGSPGDYERTSATTDSNGVADVQFRFKVRHFDWRILTPSHYSAGVGIPDEHFSADVVKSNYVDIDVFSPDSVAMEQELMSIIESNDWQTLQQKLEPKSVTYSSKTIRRSLSLYPKHNPQPMYVYGRFNKDSISLPLWNTVLTNGVEIREYPDVDVDLMNCGLLPPYGGKNCGVVSDFKLVRSSVVTNGIRKFSGYIEFAPGCGAYIRKKSNDASFNTVYAADTNAVYLSRIPFSSDKDLASNKVVSASLILNSDEYMVMRTRATYDAIGNPANWCYSKVEGKIVVNRSFWFDRIVFNPRSNDPNLEVGENLSRLQSVPVNMSE